MHLALLMESKAPLTCIKSQAKGQTVCMVPFGSEVSIFVTWHIDKLRPALARWEGTCSINLVQHLKAS